MYIQIKSLGKFSLEPWLKQNLEFEIQLLHFKPDQIAILFKQILAEALQNTFCI
jgi:hypothetical protein